MSPTTITNPFTPSSTSRLWQPVKVGRYDLKHRVALAPLTRLRADDEHVPLPFVKDYYAQRGAVEGTLLVSEATPISPQGAGLLNTPGIWRKDQIEAWKKVTDAVHEKGSFIFVQLWAMGRAASPEAAAKHGKDIVSSGNIPLGPDAPVPRPLTEPEIHQIIGDYAQAALNAVEAGFDGVEIHGANGYLVDQFIQDKANDRTDAWGGSIEKRSRFAIEVTKAIANAIGADRTAIRLSPWGSFQGMRMADLVPQFAHVVSELKKLNLAYLHLVSPRIDGFTILEGPIEDSADFILDIWNNTSPVLIAGGLTGKTGYELVDSEHPKHDIIATYGRPFISTPDLPYRLRKGISLNAYNRDQFYIPKSPEGYITYPFSDEFKAEFPSRL